MHSPMYGNSVLFHAWLKQPSDWVAVLVPDTKLVDSKSLCVRAVLMVIGGPTQY